MSETLSSVIPYLGQRPVYFDGGFGTQLQRRGLPQGTPPPIWNIQNPTVVKAVHLAYLDAGADIVTSNTFIANRWFTGDQAAATSAAGVAIARESARKAGHGVVALDIGPSGRMLEPFGDLPLEDAIAGFAETIAAGVAEGPDFILLETFTDAYEAKAAVLAAKACTDLPVLVSFSFSDGVRLMTGLEARGVAAMFESLGVSAVGANCGMGPDGMAPVIRELARSTRLPVFANPNNGRPKMENGQAVYNLTPDGYAALAASLFDEGAWMVGGCCGTGPEHIRALRSLSQDKRLTPRPASIPAVITSGARTCGIDSISNISDALNASSNPRFRALISAWDGGVDSAEEIAEEAVELAFDALDDGADALRVSLDGTASPDFYRILTPKIQTAVHIPLIFEDADRAALTMARRVYNGHNVADEAPVPPTVVREGSA
ncbi:MAG: homocysteine S-methyltransferase family protein [Oscillospiraceae bacterium]|jgi:5-methyltetrahydrofolate--homocysteine methyltransferase|nr:homocysteine S-methyltransferase family protein [Oscillospiraceae bacterium]